MVHVGESVADLIRYNAIRGRFGAVNIEQEVRKRLNYLREGSAYSYQSTFPDGRVIEIRGQPMPDGGFVTTYTDITEFKSVENALVEAKESLEQRVADRTAKLEDTMLALRGSESGSRRAPTSPRPGF